MNRKPVLLMFTRHFKNVRPPKSWEKDGVKYGLVTYYPRHPDQEDPPITPSKLFMVVRVKGVKGNPYWEKAILKDLGIDGYNRYPAIVKNTPEMCSQLWKIKHLVKITPIKLPEKLPDPDDLNGCYLHENGTFSVTPKVDPLRVEAVEQFRNNPKKMDKETIKEKIRYWWMSGELK